MDFCPCACASTFRSFQEESVSCGSYTIGIRDLSSNWRSWDGTEALDGVLVDSSTERAVGGTGTSFNWLEARNSFLRTTPHLRMIAAGGLAPENVKHAMRHPSALGRRCGERRGKGPGQEGSRTSARFHPVSTGSGRRDLSDGNEMRRPIVNTVTEYRCRSFWRLWRPLRSRDSDGRPGRAGARLR